MFFFVGNMLIEMFSSRFVYTACIIWIFFWTLCLCQRRISSGMLNVMDKPFMVYIVRSPQSDKKYNAWLCGGTIISPSQVLTSAACLIDVSNVYVIAGYKYYLNARYIDNNECTKREKRMVIKFCYPKAYNFSYSDPNEWVNLDIAVATVHKPFNFTDISYRLFCSYVPQAALINYDSFYQQPETQAIAYGWGRISHIRRPSDPKDQNSELLRADITEIMNKSDCKLLFKDYKAIPQIIEKYMICARGNGAINSIAEIEKGDLGNEECKKSLRAGLHNQKCMDDDYIDYDFRRKAATENVTDKLKQEQNSSSLNPYHNINIQTRRSICENDHGGPLITWIGREQVVVGVAVTPTYDSRFSCQGGASMFVSTHCVGEMLECLITTKRQVLRKCTATARSQGFEISERNVQWRKGGVELYEERQLQVNQLTHIGLKTATPEITTNSQ